MNQPESSIRPVEKRHRVVALINPVLHCRSTCRQLIDSGVNLVGIVEAQPRTAGLPVSTFRRVAGKQGVVTALSQVAARLAYLARNRRADSKIYEELFDRSSIESTISDWAGTVIECRKYDEDAAIESIRSLKPDILVVHTQTWVPRSVREIPTTGIVLGGHPGLTPHYRGSHSSFWALHNKQPEMVGWTAFNVDSGVDTGDVVVQGRLKIESNDSFMSLNWRGMKEIATAQANAIRQLDASGRLQCRPHQSIPEKSDYGLPGLRDYLRYLNVQKAVR